MKTFVALLCVALFGLQIRAGLKLRDLDAAWVAPESETKSKWHPEVFKSLTFGQLPAAIDWLWLKVLQDTQIMHIDRVRRAGVYFDLDLASDLDPLFYDIYDSGSSLLSVIRDDVNGARDLLIKGEKVRKELLPQYGENFQKRFWRSDWRLPFLLAYVYLLELQDMPHAAAAFGEAAIVPGAPEYLMNLKQRLEKPGGQFEVADRVLGFMLNSEKDERVKSELEKKKGNLAVAKFIYDINFKFKAFAPLPKTASNVEWQMKWRAFQRQNALSGLDFWGGKLSVDGKSGAIVTTTPFNPVFGLGGGAQNT